MKNKNDNSNFELAAWLFFILYLGFLMLFSSLIVHFIINLQN